MEKSRAPSSVDRCRRTGRGLQAQNSGVLEYAGPRESPVQGILRPRFSSDRGENLGFPTGGRPAVSERKIGAGTGFGVLWYARDRENAACPAQLKESGGI